MYKLYQTTKPIPWVSIDNQLAPDINITDEWFNFQLVESNTIFFETWDRGKIVIKDLNITYFKLEKENKPTSYWYVSKVNKVLKTGYEVQIQLDIFMSYTKSVLKAMIDNNISPYVNRVYFNKRMLFQNEDLRKLIFYSFYQDDPLINNVAYSYQSHKAETGTVAFLDEGILKDFKFPAKSNPAKFSGATSTVGEIQYSPKTNINNTSAFFNQECVLMLNKNGYVDAYPIDDSKIEGTKWYNNTIKGLMEYVVGRQVEGANNLYANDSFLGIYRIPWCFTNQDYTFEYTWKQSGGYTLIFTHFNIWLDSFSKVRFPRAYIPFHNDLKDTYIEQLQPHIWGAQEINLNKYFSHSEEDIKANKLSWSLWLNFNWNGAGCCYPTNYYYNTPDDIISFGLQLPSYGNLYYETIRQINYRFDTGQANIMFGVAQGLPSAAGKFAASTTWGIASGINSIITLGRDIYNLERNTTESKWNASLGKTLSTSQTMFWVMNFRDFVSKFNLNRLPSGQSYAAFNACLLKQFTESSKQQIRFILKKNGFILNQPLNMNMWWSNIAPDEDSVFIKMDKEWLITNLYEIDSNLNIEQQELIINQLSKGFIINRRWV